MLKSGAELAEQLDDIMQQPNQRQPNLVSDLPCPLHDTRTGIDFEHTHHDNGLCGHPADGDEEAGALLVVVAVAAEGAPHGVVVPGVDRVVAAKVANLEVEPPADQTVPAKGERGLSIQSKLRGNLY